MLFEGDLIYLPMIVLATASLITVLIRGRISNYITSISSMISCAFMLYISYKVLILGQELSSTIIIDSDLRGIPLNFLSIHLHVDSLSGIFIFILGIVGFLASLYGISYMSRFYGREHLGFYGFNYMVFLLSMYLTLVAWDLFWFIIFWEIMSLSSQFLVSYEKEKPRAVWGGYKYFCMTKAGSELLITAVLLSIIICAGFNTHYNVVADALRRADPLLLNVVIALLFIGLAVKASLVPFHTWLPDAHPEAPSNVSALLSGVMIKIAVYMMYRLFFFFTAPSIYWGAFIAVLGTITLFTGTMYALAQTDSKRLLAYHSIGQIGYIALGLGVALLFIPMDNQFYKLLGVIGLFGSLYHAINHALFKSLLFLTAGSVMYRTDSRNLDNLGGLGKYMPLTSISALIGSLSISGIPPFNGFISKWLLYTATIPSQSLIAVLGAVALFISGATTASFIKFYTSLFTKPARMVYRDNLKEVPFSMTLSQLLLSATCILFGVLPIIPWLICRSFIEDIAVDYNIDIARISIYPGLILVKGVSVNYIIIITLALITASILLLYMLLAKQSSLVNHPWSCGMPYRGIHMSVPSRGYYEIFEHVFHEIYDLGKTLYRLAVDLGYIIYRLLQRLLMVIENPPYMLLFMKLVITIYFIVLLMKGVMH